MRNYMKAVMGGIAVLLCLSVVATHAAQVTLAWDPPTNNTDGTPLTDLLGYKLAYGTATGVYGTPVDVGNVTSWSLSGLTEGQTYYSAARAYNSLGNDSAYCTELVFTVPDKTAPVITLPASVTVYAGANGKAPLPNLVQQAVVSDNVSPSAAITVTQSPLAGVLANLGTTVVTVSATDQASNTAQVAVNVIVADNTAPTLTLTTNTLTITAATNGQASVPSVTSYARVSDNCTATQSIVITQSPVAGSTVLVGSHSIVIRATDGSGNYREATMTLVVSPRNVAPSVNAGSDIAFRLPTTQGTLSGTVTDDGLPTGSPLVITWSKVSGPGTVAFAQPNAAQTGVTITQVGTYVLRITANDGEFQVTDNVTVVVSPEPVPAAPKNLRVIVNP